MRQLVKPAEQAGMLTAGYIEVSAHGRAVMDDSGRSMYYPFTSAQYSVTVRDPKGTGSGWAGVDWYDWTRINTEQLSAMALEKCLASRNPVAVEPGRYTAILEPQAVCDLWSALIATGLYRPVNEYSPYPFFKSKGFSRLGETVIDPRITISADPMDPDLAFPPFSPHGDVYRPVKWITNGVLTDLWYTQDYAVRELGSDQSLYNSGAFRMSGGTTTIDEMIATTTRGLLVTRFSDINVTDKQAWLLNGYTRDGLWLIEHGKISKPVKNFRFTESPLFVFNNVEQLGVPQRVFHPEAPVVVPAVKVRDFSFTNLSDAV
jgi:predicted Zn-dependent protease